MSDRDDNPPLITPPLITPPPGVPVRSAEPVEKTSGDEPDSIAPFIALPPGILDSITHRSSGARASRRQPSDVAAAPSRRVLPAAEDSASTLTVPNEIVFFPNPISLEGASASASSAGAGVADGEPTVGAEVGSAAVGLWRLSLPGVTYPMEVGAAIFVGRNPARTPDHPAAGLLPVVDPAKSVSKTHAMFEVHAGELYVHDLDSTNGVFVLAPGLDEVQVHPGARHAVPSGSVVELGDFAITVARAE